MSLAPRALVLNAPGINCNLETGFAIEQAGGIADQVHINTLEAGEVSLDDYQMFVLSGGFSHGDHIASGRILGLELRQKPRLAEGIDRFTQAGKAILGICNGFQVLVESGLLPDGNIASDRSDKITSLVANRNLSFECRWGRLQLLGSVCRFIPEDYEGKTVELPSAHAEGNFYHQYSAQDLYETEQIVMQFVDGNNLPTEVYPLNPNGSPGGVTAICNKEGNILGMMPHPERFVLPTQHPNWRRGEGADPFGRVIFNGMVDYARNM